METSSVTVRYRPIRIGWAIKSGDFDAYRRAVRYSYALWGGRFNPIIMVDRPEADDLVRTFRVDGFMPIGDHQNVKDFIKRHDHLSCDFMGEDDPIFIKGNEHMRSYARILDVENAFWHLHNKPELEQIKKEGVKLFNWAQDDVLADVFLVYFGAYPGIDEIGMDYKGRVVASADGRDFNIPKDHVIQPDILNVLSIPYLSRMGIQSMPYHRGRWINHGGYYLGDAGDLDDLVNWWNLRAADVPLLFVDRGNLARYAQAIPRWYELMEERALRYRPEYRHVGVWLRDANPAPERMREIFGDKRLMVHPMSGAVWNGYNLAPPIMYLAQRPAIGLMGGDDDQPSVTFQLPDKPYSDKPLFLGQHLAISALFNGGLYKHDMHTLLPSCVPELNRFYSSKMFLGGNELRVEQDSVAVLEEVYNDECTLRALHRQDLITQLLKLAGYSATPSAAGLSTRQLITNLGGVRYANALKIPGVRKLLDTFGPNESFTKKGALGLIGSKGDFGRPGLTFKDFEKVYIEPRGKGESLTQDEVFGYLLEKKLFRVGVDLLCPKCQLPSWYALERVHEKVTCELCENRFEPQRQLADADQFTYRRSGILGLEKNTHGALPVVLTLAYLEEEARARTMVRSHSSLSLNLKRLGVADDNGCETDFVWVEDRVGDDHDRVAVAVAESKKQGPITEGDVENLKRVALAFPTTHIDAYVILSKIAPFTDSEIALARRLNDEHHLRAILLWGRELELTHMQRLRVQKTEPMVMGHSLRGMAEKTHELYFQGK